MNANKMPQKSGIYTNLHISIFRALIKLLAESIDPKTLPSKCDQWRFPEEYAEWHKQKIAEAHRSHSTRLPTLLSFIISLLWLQLD
jgi:hypothetical protein